ncbi:hypothetical protein A2U01_0077812, partial [Trifolium medium]|nr:hypothetical protein [Trifolium medium]
EPEVTSVLDEGKNNGGKKDDKEEEEHEKEGLSGDNQSEDRPVGSGQDMPTIVKPSGRHKLLMKSKFQEILLRDSLSQQLAWRRRIR